MISVKRSVAIPSGGLRHETPCFSGWPYCAIRAIIGSRSVRPCPVASDVTVCAAIGRCRGELPRPFCKDKKMDGETKALLCLLLLFAGFWIVVAFSLRGKDDEIPEWKLEIIKKWLEEREEEQSRPSNEEREQ